MNAIERVKEGFGKLERDLKIIDGYKFTPTGWGSFQEVKTAISALPEGGLVLTAAQAEELRKVLDLVIRGDARCDCELIQSHDKDCPALIAFQLEEVIYGDK